MFWFKKQTLNVAAIVIISLILSFNNPTSSTLKSKIFLEDFSHSDIDYDLSKHEHSTHCPHEAHDNSDGHFDLKEEIWPSIKSPIMELSLGANMSHFDDDQIEPDQKNQMDTDFGMVNNRFWSKSSQTSSERKDEIDNWRAWRAIISYFPSSKKYLKEQSLSKNLKSNNLNNEESSKDKLSVQQVQPVKLAETTTNSEPSLSQLMFREKSELDQQDPMIYLEPMLMYAIEQDSNPPVNQLNSSQPLIPSSIREIKERLEEKQPDFDSFSSATAERARNSLLKAADVARQLNFNKAAKLQPLNLTNTGWTIENATSNRNPFSQRQSLEVLNKEPVFLGFGQLQRIDPFNNNGRTQARLSCRFGEDMKNMTISNVEWARFSGDYDINDQSFQCKRDSTTCRLNQVKTDVLTTVHPRPPVQNYINTMVPSYSVTLHEVNENQLGIYRCSALRIMDGHTELVYRLIPFE